MCSKALREGVVAFDSKEQNQWGKVRYLMLVGQNGGRLSSQAFPAIFRLVR